MLQLFSAQSAGCRTDLATAVTLSCKWHTNTSLILKTQMFKIANASLPSSCLNISFNINFSIILLFPSQSSKLTLSRSFLSKILYESDFLPILATRLTNHVFLDFATLTVGFYNHEVHLPAG